MAAWLVRMALVCWWPKCAAVGQVSQTNEHQRVSEGQYVRLKNNLKVSGSEQNWILWRAADGGFELEDHFAIVDPADQVLAALSGANLSPQLRKELEAAVQLTEFSSRLGSDHRPQSLTLRGNRLSNGKPIETLHCNVGPDDVRCNGINQKAKLQTKKSEEFFYEFPFPMLVSGWLTDLTAGATETSARLICLDAGLKARNSIRLFPCERHIIPMDDESLTIGDREFQAHKARIQLRDQDQTLLELTVWYAGRGVVYAMEGGGPPGERIALVQYKKYSDF
jgi:hypothetical protein